jgi:hypothetical protein
MGIFSLGEVIMSTGEDRYAVILQVNNRLLARWLRPVEAAAYVEAFNRLLNTGERGAAMVLEAPHPPPTLSPLPAPNQSNPPDETQS